MGNAYGTSMDQMATSAQHVFQVNDSVQGELSRLQSQLAPLAGAWKGQASTAFQNLMTRYDENARTLNEALRGIGEAIQVSGQTYQQQEEEQSSSMSGITSALG